MKQGIVQLFARRIDVRTVEYFLATEAQHIGWQCLFSDYEGTDRSLEQDIEVFVQVREKICQAGRKSVFLTEPSTDLEILSRILKDVQPDIFLPGGKRTPEVLQSLSEQFPCMELMVPIPIPVAGAVPEGFDALKEAEQYASFCHWFLTDTITAAGQVGCSGQTSDWSLMFDFINKAPRPVIAAGGLRPDNVAQVAVGCSPAGYDAHTAVCTLDGWPDREKAMAFAKAVEDL